MDSNVIYFERASLKHQELIFAWLLEPHMLEYWDNSQEHKDDIQNFIHGRRQHYFYGTTQYWIGYVTNQPFSIIISDRIRENQEDLTDLHRKHLSKTGHTIALDFGIGNKNYLSQGLAASTLQAFTEFYQTHIDPKADTFFIDPDQNNLRALHVYEKAGFKMVGFYHVKEGFFKEQQSCLMVKNMTQFILNENAYCIEYFYAKSGFKEKLIESLLNLVKLTKTEEGCLQYELIQDNNNADLIILLVKFETQEQMKKHENQNYIKVFAENEMQQYCEKFVWNEGNGIGY